jgi:flagellar biosynthesis repressor protein FlbT
MALKITLKPRERLILGGAPVTIIRNGESTNDLIIENKIPVLIRGKDIMLEHDATSPCRKIYFVIQLMYVDGSNLSEYHSIYWRLVQSVIEAAPSTLGFLDQISEYIFQSKYYQALKVTRQLIDYEHELLKNTQKTNDKACTFVCM